MRNAFRSSGHNAYSIDLVANDDRYSRYSDYHYTGDVLRLLDGETGWEETAWDMMIAFPPCTHLSVSGARWFKEKKVEQFHALYLVKRLMDMNIAKIAIENPVSIISTYIRKPDQIIQPWQFGHGETKATCLWLKNLPKLKPTNIVSGRSDRIHKMPPSEDRSRLRSITYQGVADAMADQWG